MWLTAVLIALADGGLLLRGSSATVTVEGRSTPVPTGLTVGQALGRLGLSVAGDLLAVDHSVLRKGAYPPRVLVNGNRRQQPDAWVAATGSRCLPGRTGWSR